MVTANGLMLKSSAALSLHDGNLTFINWLDILWTVTHVLLMSFCSTKFKSKVMIQCALLHSFFFACVFFVFLVFFYTECN